MTPDTTPAPMTHERALAIVDRVIERSGHIVAADVVPLRAYIEAERTRADALAAEVESLRSRVEVAEAEVADAKARCLRTNKRKTRWKNRAAELEAGIGRLAERYLWLRRCALSGTPAFAYGIPRPLTEAEFDAAVDASINFRHELGCPAAAITAARHDCTCDPLRITHEEGRDDG